MKSHSIKIPFALIVFALLIPVALAESDSIVKAQPVHTLAKILVDLNHYPSTKEKEQLQAIAKNSDNSDAIQSIAMAIHDMQHSVSAEHKEKLQTIINDEDTAEDEKELAEILLGITHRPNDEARARLKKLIQ